MRAPDVERLLAHLRHAAGDDLPDLARVEPGALDARLLYGAEEVGRVEPREPSAAAAERRPDGFDDVHLAHELSFRADRGG